MAPKLYICIIGCTNRGKSTLFNVLCGKKIAITHNSPGVTIDCREQELMIAQIPVSLSDTPGFDQYPKNTAEHINQIIAQIERTIIKADLILHVVDANTGISHFDRKWSNFYLKYQKKAIIVVNMIDKTIDNHWQYALRFTNCLQVGISAKTRQGIHTLITEIITVLEKPWQKLTHIADNYVQPQLLNNRSEHTLKKDRLVKTNTKNLCIIGRPNAGKSTLCNQLSGTKKSIVSSQAGTTVDTVAHGLFCYKDHVYQILDTAGLRKKNRIQETVESYAANQSITHIKAKNTLIIQMIDATQGISDQDYRVLSTIERTRNQHMLLINKWDLLNTTQKNIYRQHVDSLANNRAYLPVVFMSAEKDYHYKPLLNTLCQLSQQQDMPPMSYLTKCVTKIITIHRPPIVQNKTIKIRVCYPTPNRYASVTIQGKRIRKLPLSYRRYLENKLQKILNIIGIKLEIIFKEDNNPYQ